MNLTIARSARSGPTTIALLLALLMVTTRFHHFGSLTHLPDASLAVFFLGGFYLRRPALFGCYLAQAALIDYLAITLGGVSDWCVTPAYAFLVPTYASLWFGGLWYARRHRMDWRTLAPLAGAVFVAVSAAFLISNASFYVLSGYFPAMSWTEYATRVARYFPPYASAAVAYIAIAAGLHVLATTAGARSQRA